MKKTFTLLIVFLFGLVLISTAQTALDAGQFVNAQITAPGVYTVEAGQSYAFDGRIDLAFDVTILGPDNGWIMEAENPPVFVNTPAADGAPRDFFQITEGGSLTLKNVLFSGSNSNGEISGNFVANTGGSKMIVDNCVFSDWTNFALRNQFKGDSTSITNCVFINGVRLNFSPWGGFPLRNDVACDNVVIENNTVVNSGRLTGNSGPWHNSIMHEMHNTYLNQTVAGHEQRADEMITANNIFYNFHFIGHKTENHSSPNNTYDSHFTTWNYFADSKNSLDSISLYLGQNLFFRDQVILDWFATSGGDSLAPSLLWEHADVDSFVTTDDNYTIGTNYAELDPGFTMHPGNAEAIASYINSHWLAPTGDWIDWRVPPPVTFGEDGFPVISWPPAFDLSYSNEYLQTGGTDGLPLGDLNWFPEQKAEFLANRDAIVAAIRDSMVNAQAVYDPTTMDQTPLITEIPAEATTVVDIIVNSDAHDTLEAAVLAAGLAETLAGEGPFTVFAPTDDAFAALPAGTIEALLADPEGMLTDILLYHVVSGGVLSTDLEDGLEVETLNGANITVTISNDSVFINNALVTLADIEADNGVVHVIDAVLLPPEEEPLDSAVVILDFETPETSTGFQYFGSTIDGEFTDVISNPNPSGINTSDSVTVYLKPANSETWAGAFSNPNPTTMIDATNGGEVCIDVHMDHIGNLAFKLENGNGEQNWTTIVQNTVVNEWETLCFNFDSLSQDQTTVPATGNTYNTIVLFFDFGLNDTVEVTSYFDNIVVKPGEAVETTTVVDVIVGSEAHDTLEAAVIAAGLAETLAGTGPFTVFAPTDDAFAALPAGTIETLLLEPEGLLTDILLYHVVSGNVLSTDLVDGMVVPTLNGADITVTISDDGVFINEALVIMADIQTDNGVVHVIDAVLLPPEEEPLDSAVVILDFENPETSTGFQYFGSTIDGEFTDVIANPNPSGINTSDSVTVYLKPANSQTWAGAFSNPGPAMMVDASNGGEVCIDVHMDHIGNLGFKLENGTAEQNWINVVENTVVNEWETLCFNFDSISFEEPFITATGNSYSTIVLFFDFGSNDVMDVTSYFDNIVLKPAATTTSTEIIDANTMDIKVFPNPTNGWLNIIVEDDYRFNKLEIIDLSGRVVYDKRVQGYNFKENISRIDEGMYFIRLTGDRITYSSSLIIRK